MGPWVIKYFSSVLLAGLALTQCAVRVAAQEQSPTSLPVYEVVKAGATAQEAKALADKLHIPGIDVLSESGMIVFVDSARFLSLPSEEKVENSPLLDHALEATRNKDPRRKITPTILNASAVGELHVLSEDAARSRAAEAFAAAKLTPQFGEASVGHHELRLLSPEGKDTAIANSVPIDTEVTYKFTDPHGFPIYGPGAQLHVTYDASGNVSRVIYAARQLKEAGTVRLISRTEAEEQIARQLPAKSTIKMRLVYFAPPLSNERSGPRVAALIPWYAYYATMRVANPQTGAVSEVRSKIGFIPATRDPRFVPTVRVSATGGSEVHASVEVRGGRAPYRYIWGGSHFTGLRNAESTITYTPQIRAAESLLRDPNFNLHRAERLSVTVIDANGIAVSGIANLQVVATPLFPQSRGSSNPTYGSENPGDPLHWQPARIAWNKEMATPGGGASLSFDWLGADAWPGDFIRPTPAGTLVGTPWVYGDADFANWGVDTADIVLDNADGWDDGTVLMQPGAPATDYSTSSISTPVSAQTVAINGNGFGTPASFAVNYNGSWGPVGPNDTLEWLLLDDCDMLNLNDGSGQNVAQRWGPAFGGLHVLTGFASLGYGDGPFEGGVADNVLGIHGPAQTIVQSWFNSASATGAGTAAAMGPAFEIMPGIFICDFNDYFWGKGTVGPTLVPSSFPAGTIAYWYLTDTSSIQYLF